jgi:hypothetical protein
VEGDYLFPRGGLNPELRTVARREHGMMKLGQRRVWKSDEIDDRGTYRRMSRDVM